VSCAVETKCDYFLSTDDFLMRKLEKYDGIKSLNPISFLNIPEEAS
jgi:hypothetical protein